MADHTPTAADWQNAIDNLSPEDREFLHRPLVEDVWHNAIARLPATTKPLVDLLRSTPIPPAIADLLADYLNGDIVGGRLVYVPSDEMRQMVGSSHDRDDKSDPGWLALDQEYHDEVRRLKQARQKDPAGEAARIVGAKIKLQEARSFYKKRRAWLNLAHRIREWLRGR